MEVASAGEVPVNRERAASGQSGHTSGSGSSASARASFGFALRKGLRRKPMEDFLGAEFRRLSDGSEIGLLSVFDGHSGRRPAKYLQRHLLNNILHHPLFHDDRLLAIEEAYRETDKNIVEKADEGDKWQGGSTATTCLLLEGGTRLVVANVGDSRAVMSTGGRAVDVSCDHDPAKPEERAMVESKGGIVIKRPGSGAHRVDGYLAMSRAFGDADIKEHLSVEPDIWDGKLGPEDRTLIVASDGVWHVMSSQEAVDFIQEFNSPESAAKHLAKRALDLGSADDISVIVVYLNWAGLS